jgi:hypothetical protein
MNLIEQLMTSDKAAKAGGEPNLIETLMAPKSAANSAPAQIPFEGPVQVKPPISGLEHNPNEVSYPHPKGFVDTLVHEVKSGRDNIGAGVAQLGQSLPVSGLGNVALGGLQILGSPFTATAKTMDKAAGVEGFGDRAMLALPAKGLGQIVKSKMPSEIAIKNVVDAIGLENLPRVIKELKSNDRLSPVDVSEQLLLASMKLQTTPGKHQQRIYDFNKGRLETSNDAVKQAMDDTLGVPVNALQKINEMKAQARKTGDDLINPLVEGKRQDVNVRSVLDLIEKEFGTGPVAKATFRQIMKGEAITGPQLSNYQKRLVEEIDNIRGQWKGDFIDIKGEQGLHQKQKELRAEAQAMLDSADGLTRRDGERLMKIRKAYVDAIDKTAPGYAKALDKYADDMQVQEGFERGFTLLNKSTKIQNRPEFLVDEIAKLEKAGKTNVIEAMREGARLAADSLARQYRNQAKRSENVLAADINTEKLTALFGEKETRQLLTRLEQERKISNTDSRLHQNSKTADSQAADAKIYQPTTAKDNKIDPSAFLPPAAEATAMYLSGGQSMGAAAATVIGANLAKKYVVNPTKNRYGNKQNEEFAKVLTATGEERQAVIQALESYLPNKSLPKTTQTLQTLKNLALPAIPP